MTKDFGLVWGQCSAALQAHLKSGIDPKLNDFMTLHDAVAFMYNTKQGKNESDDCYHE